MKESTLLKIPSHWEELSSSNHHKLFQLDDHSTNNNSNPVQFHWNSRSQRKGIHPVPLPSSSLTNIDGTKVKDSELGEKKLTGEKEKEKEKEKEQWKIKRLPIRFIGFDFWDISWWISILFLIGSIFWCINGTLFFVYFTNDSLAYTNTESATAFLGGTFFIVGAALGWIESLNPSLDADFGWEIDNFTHTLIEPSHAKGSLGRNRHHFGSFSSSSPSPPSSSSSLSSSPTSNSSKPKEKQEWRWYGTSNSLAYYANSIQLFGASIFWISTICGLPGVLPLVGTTGGVEQGGKVEGLWIGLYWCTQVIGAPCFVIAGAMFCIEVQKKWWKPNPLNIGWQIGFWNLIGGFGFWFCGIFGIWRQSSLSDPSLYQKWGTAFSTFWGSWAFLIGSYIQLYEGINKISSI